MKNIFTVGVIYTLLFLIFIFLFLVSAWAGSFVGVMVNLLFLGVLTLRIANYIKEQIEKQNK